MRRFGTSALCLVAALVVGACRETPARAGNTADATVGLSAGRELKVGDEAPDFSLPGSDGRTYALADYRGRQAVVFAWFAKAFSDA